MLPNFLIIGAAKSATTWLMRQLNRHPCVYVYDTEIYYFSRYYAKRLPWYEAHFKKTGDKCAVGENSNGYLPHPEAPRRIHRLLPGAKLIAVLREPTDRAYSAYCMQYARGRATDDIGAHLDPDRNLIGRFPDVLTPGFYAKQLERYLRLFPATQIKVLLYDDLKADNHAFLCEILEFLEVDPTLQPAAEGELVNVRRTSNYPVFLRAIISATDRRPGMKALLRNIATRPLGKAMRERLATRRIAYPPLTEELREKLAAYYAQDMAELEILINRDLGDWRNRGG